MHSPGCKQCGLILGWLILGLIQLKVDITHEQLSPLKGLRNLGLCKELTWFFTREAPYYRAFANTVSQLFISCNCCFPSCLIFLLSFPFIRSHCNWYKIPIDVVLVVKFVVKSLCEFFFLYFIHPVGLESLAQGLKNSLCLLCHNKPSKFSISAGNNEIKYAGVSLIGKASQLILHTAPQRAALKNPCGSLSTQDIF